MSRRVRYEASRSSRRSDNALSSFPSPSSSRVVILGSLPTGIGDIGLEDGGDGRCVVMSALRVQKGV